MDSKKLAKLIKKIVEIELKRQLPKMVEELMSQYQREITPENVGSSMLRMEEEITMNVPRETNTRRLSSNPVLNDILNNTKPFSERTNESTETVSFDHNIAQAGVEGLRAQMAHKMGLTPISGGGARPNGLGVNTGVPALDKAMNRDYSELVKRFKK